MFTRGALHVRIFVFLLCCFTSGSLAQPLPALDSTPSQASDAKVKAAAVRLAWHNRMAVRPKPSGCFSAIFPSETWREAQCAVAPKLTHRRPLPLAQWPRKMPTPEVTAEAPSLAVAGNGNDLVAVAVGGPITGVEGFFDPVKDIQSVTSVTSPTQGAPGAYALQINVEPFSTPACANAQTPQTCQGWLQYLFMNDNNGSLALMEVWLFNFGSSCPGEGSVPPLPDMPQGVSWVHTGSDCVFDSKTTPLLPAQPVSSLGQLRMRGEAVNGGQDSVTITLPNGTISGVAIPDALLKLSAVWQQVEFNVVGYVNAQRATFNSGAAAVVHINVENGTTNAPNIINSGFTGETNTFNLVPPGCASAGDPPSIAFEEISLTGQKSLACPPVIATPPPPPEPTPCQQATEAVSAAQKVLAQAQARLQTPLCSGPASINCEKTVQADQALLNAAVIQRNKACKP